MEIPGYQVWRPASTRVGSGLLTRMKGINKVISQTNFMIKKEVMRIFL
jgi:hypothetical protein